jgi:hypothetical protein
MREPATAYSIYRNGQLWHPRSAEVVLIVLNDALGFMLFGVIPGLIRRYLRMRRANIPVRMAQVVRLIVAGAVILAAVLVVGHSKAWIAADTGNMAACHALYQSSGKTVTHAEVEAAIKTGEHANDASYRNWTLRLVSALNENSDPAISQALNHMDSICSAWGDT